MFGDYICVANNSLGTLKRTITLINGTKPPPPLYIKLRGVNSNTFDLDIGAKKSGPPDAMDIIGYRFEIIPVEQNQSNSGKWANARVVLKDFTEGKENLSKLIRNEKKTVENFDLFFGSHLGVTFLVNNLSPNTTYYIRVASRNRAGISDWEGPKEFRTHAKAVYGHAETTKSTEQSATQSTSTASTSKSPSHLISMNFIEILMLYSAYVTFSLSAWNCLLLN